MNSSAYSLYRMMCQHCSFLQHSDTYVLAKDQLHLECRVRGEPKPTIVWTKDDRPVVDEDDDRIEQLDEADGYCKLIIRSPSEADNGTYACVATNELNVDRTVHNVLFDGRDAYIIQKVHRLKHRNIKVPFFSNQLGEHMVTKGGTIGLQAELLHDASEVHWFRDNERLRAGPTVRTYMENGVHTLIVQPADLFDRGTYVCRATNDFGRAEAVGHVYMVGPAADGGVGTCPLFLVRPESEQTLKSGEPFSISFTVSGDPKPKGMCFRFGKSDMWFERVTHYAIVRFYSHLHEGLERSHAERSSAERTR